MILVICLAIVVMLLILCIAVCVVKRRSNPPLRAFAESPDVQEDLMKGNPQAANHAMRAQQQQPPLHFAHAQQRHTLPSAQLQQQPQQPQGYQSQYQANLANAASASSNDRNMNLYVNKLEQPLPPPPPPPSLHNESSGNSNWGQQQQQPMYHPGHPNMMNFTDSSSSTKYNGAASLYGGQGSSVSQNQYEVPHAHARGSNPGLSSMGSGRYPSGYQPQQQQPIYPYRSQQYGYCEE